MDFLKLLESKPIVVLDGAMGTMLESRGAAAGAPACLSAPEVLLGIHREYVEAGSDAIITNTFSMNRINIDTHAPDIDLAAVNRAGVEIARKAAAGRAAVLGGLGPTAQMLAPLGPYDEKQFYETFLEQARVLDAAGIDAFIIETFMDLKEAVCAVRACKENFRIPVIASMTYKTDKDGGRTLMGDRAADCAAALAAAGADAVGANCGSLEPERLAAIVASYRSACSLPALVEPNAGKPRLVDGRTVFDVAPAAFAEGVRACIDAGATIIGGCCGTTPAHIRAIASL
jgi:5-methyltetrahydrofolate--homocysteine methyltransferase